jgi:hypothetical protein
METKQNISGHSRYYLQFIGLMVARYFNDTKIVRHGLLCIMMNFPSESSPDPTGAITAGVRSVPESELNELAKDLLITSVTSEIQGLLHLHCFIRRAILSNNNFINCPVRSGNYAGKKPLRRNSLAVCGFYRSNLPTPDGIRTFIVQRISGIFLTKNYLTYGKKSRVIQPLSTSGGRGIPKRLLDMLHAMSHVR